MFFTPRQMHQTWGNVKRFMGQAYVHGRKWAGLIDGYANVGERLLGAAAPMLDELGAGRAIQAGVQGLSQYDQIKHRVMDVDERGRGHLGRIAAAAPELF